LIFLFLMDNNILANIFLLYNCFLKFRKNLKDNLYNLLMNLIYMFLLLIFQNVNQNLHYIYIQVNNKLVDFLLNH